MTSREPCGFTGERTVPEMSQPLAAADAGLTSLPLHSVSVTVLAILAVLYTLYFASPILLPVALAIYLNLLLAPVMSLLTTLRVPFRYLEGGTIVSLLIAK